MAPDTTNYMEASGRTFVTSTVLSTLAHGAAFISLALVLEHTTSVGQDSALDIQLELIASDEVVNESSMSSRMSSQWMQHTERAETVVSESVPFQSEPRRLVNTETVVKPVNSTANGLTESDAIDEKILTAGNSDALISYVQGVTEDMAAENAEPAVSASQNTGLPQAVDHQLVALLHSHISEQKQYPYLARRQRREGVATVSFVLHPNGEIENTHLVSSSRTAILDRAALSAVENIEPFEAAHNYLETAETFNIDVVFELM